MTDTVISAVMRTDGDCTDRITQKSIKIKMDANTATGATPDGKAIIKLTIPGYKYTCDTCGDRMLSDREGATTCKRCIAEQAKEEQIEADVAFVMGEQKHRHEHCENCNYETSCALNEVEPGGEICKSVEHSKKFVVELEFDLKQFSDIRLTTKYVLGVLMRKLGANGVKINVYDSIEYENCHNYSAICFNRKMGGSTRCKDCETGKHSKKWKINKKINRS